MTRFVGYALVLLGRGFVVWSVGFAAGPATVFCGRRLVPPMVVVGGWLEGCADRAGFAGLGIGGGGDDVVDGLRCEQAGDAERTVGDGARRAVDERDAVSGLLHLPGDTGGVAGHVDAEVDADLAGVFALELKVAETALAAVAVDDYRGRGGGVGGECGAERRRW